MRKIFDCIQLLRFLLVYPFWSSDEKLEQDVERWKKILGLQGTYFKVLKKLLWSHKEFRNLVIYRYSDRPFFKRWIAVVYPPMESLYIEAKEIGGGLFIQHGFATMIAAEKIGENCWINQQVTIGYKDNTRSPIIGNNVMITCGAKVLGNITVGDNSVIGANAVVVKDVEPGSTMVGIPAKPINTRE